MRGVSQLAALSILLIGVWSAARADVSAPDRVRAIAREKAAAIVLLRSKSVDVLSTVSQDRLFAAYLNATTQGEGARIRARIDQALATFIRRFGFTSFQLIDRSGAVISYVATAKGPSPAQFDIHADHSLELGFARDEPGATSTLLRNANAPGWNISVLAPVLWHGQAEFVLRARQDGAVYRRVLGLGLDRARYAVLADERGQILADTRSAAAKPDAQSMLSVAGQSLPALRRSLGGRADAGSGTVSQRNENFSVSYSKAGDWTVVVVESVPPPRRCTKDGERLCG